MLLSASACNCAHTQWAPGAPPDTGRHRRAPADTGAPGAKAGGACLRPKQIKNAATPGWPCKSVSAPIVARAFGPQASGAHTQLIARPPPPNYRLTASRLLAHLPGPTILLDLACYQDDVSIDGQTYKLAPARRHPSAATAAPTATHWARPAAPPRHQWAKQAIQLQRAKCQQDQRQENKHSPAKRSRTKMRIESRLYSRISHRLVRPGSSGSPPGPRFPWAGARARLALAARCPPAPHSNGHAYRITKLSLPNATGPQWAPAK